MTAPTAAQIKFVKDAPATLLAKASPEQLRKIVALARTLRYECVIDDARVDELIVAQLRADGETLCLDMEREFSPKHPGKCALSGAKVASFNKCRMMQLEGWDKARLVTSEALCAMQFRGAILSQGNMSASAWRLADTVDFETLQEALDAGKTVRYLKRSTGVAVQELSIRKVGQSYQGTRATYSTTGKLRQALKGATVFAVQITER